MEIIELKRNIHTLNIAKYVFAYDISCDCYMESDIIKPFEKRHRFLKKICLDYSRKNGFSVLGTTLKHSDENGVVYNMFTKQWKSEILVKEEDLKSCFKSLKEQMVKSNEKNLAIPRIDYNISNYRWDDIKEIIIDTFKDTDIKVLVCYQ